MCRNANYDDQLWTTDGTPGGTREISDIGYDGGGRVNLAELTVVNGRLFFVATDSTHGSELWTSDGTASGTVLVKDIAPGAQGSSATDLVSFNGSLYFNASDGTNSSQIWKSDGTAAGTTLVTTLYPNPSQAPGIRDFVVAGSHFFFMDNSLALWESDGTAAGTYRTPGLSLVGSQPYMLVVNNILYCNGSQGVYRTDGTAAGTYKLYNTGSTGLPDMWFQPAAANGYLYFYGVDSNRKAYFWQSNGTTAGTIRVPGISASDVGLNIVDEQAVGQLANGTLFFRFASGDGGVQLWTLPSPAVPQMPVDFAASVDVASAGSAAPS